LPPGIVSSSTQVNTGSFSGSLTGSLQGTASVSVTSSYALTASVISPFPVFGSVYENPLSHSGIIPAGYDFITFGSYVVADGVILIVSGRHIIL
jgi:hypothetical protein